MKNKIKYLKKNALYPVIENAPLIETLEINSLKTRKRYIGSSANIILAFNIIFLILCLFYMISYLCDFSNYLIKCETFCFLSAINLLCCLQFVLSSSYLIIAIKMSNLEYYRKYNFMMISICLFQFLKIGIYFFVHEMIGEDNCIFDYNNYEATIIECGILILVAFIFLYFIRNLKNLETGMNYNKN